MTPRRRVLVTGSRDLPVTARRIIWTALDHQYHWGDNGPLTVVHGDADGGDRMAQMWAWTRHHDHGWDVTEEAHPADWTLGRRAGPLRNAHMVELGADVCHAFIGPCTRPACTVQPVPHGSHGATGCAQLAEAAGIPTARWESWRATIR